MKAKISPKLAELASFFGQRRDRKTELTASSSALLAEQLDILVAMSLSMEQELHAFRLLEANRAGHRFLAEEAMETLRAPLMSSDGKIVRPNFRRKS